MTTIIEVAARTHVGHVRRRNEDSVSIADLSSRRVLSADGTVHHLDAPVLAVVADGLGGHPSGEDASKVAVDAIVEARPVDAESPAQSRYAKRTRPSSRR